MKVHALGRCIGAMALGLGTGACSDDSSESSCGSFKACGGDVVGTWDWKTSCGQSTTYPAECANLQTTPQPSFTQSVTFSADGNMTITMEMDEMSYSYVYTTACFSARSGRTYTDAEFAEICANLGVLPNDTSGSSLSCTWQATACSCAVHLGAQTNTASSTYTLSGNDIAMTDPDGTTTSTPYCVSGTSLRVAGSGSEPNAFVLFEKR